MQATAEAAAKYVFDLEMQRLFDIEKRKDDQAKFVVVSAHGVCQTCSPVRSLSHEVMRDCNRYRGLPQTRDGR